MLKLGGTMPVSIGAVEHNFTNPIGLLSDCHRRIERFLQALQSVAAQLDGGPLNDDHRAALENALNYFREAAPKHNADEEEDLFPKLRKLTSPCAAAVLGEVDRLEAEHKTADAWHRQVEDLCQRWLRDNALPAEAVAELKRLLASLSDLYRAHIAVEEEQVFPAAQAGLSAPELEAIGRSMASRRGVPFLPASRRL